MHLIETLLKLFNRDLEKLKIEMSSNKNEKKMCEISGDVKNSAENLCLHICGNPRHFFGAVFGDSGSVRKHLEEFNKRVYLLKKC